MSSTIIMVIMICVGLAIGLVGMIIVGRKAFALNKAFKKLDMPRIQEISRRIQELAPRIEETKAKQAELAARMREFEIAKRRLDYLRDELDSATGWLFNLRS